jgi:predicted amidohydrolase YtcJ
LEREVVVEWKDANSALRDIEKAAKAAKPGEVVVIPTRVNSLSINLCDALRLEEIDAVTGNTPVFFVELVNIAGYGANSKAAALLDLPPGTPRFRSDGSACLGPRNPLGFVDATAATKAIDDYLFWRVPLEEQMPAYRLGSQRASAHGITLVKEHSSLQLLTGIRELWARGELTVRMRMPFPLYPDSGTFEVTVPKDKAEALFKRMGNVSGIGDDMWRFEGVRPGAIGGPVMQGTMWTIDAKVRNLPGKPNLPYGMKQPTSDETFPGREAVVQAVRYGWDVSGDHTVGDRSVLEYLKAIEEGLKTQVVKRPNQRFTIAHTPMARPEEIQKMKELGIMPSIGLWHLFFPPMADSAVYQYGEGVQKIAPVKSYIKMGIKPALEGDSFDYTPFWRMGVAITRKDYKGRIFNASEKITRQEALWMSTNWPAYHIGEENKLGTIEPGKLADLVVVDGDYMNVPEDEISKIDALMTVVGGKVVFEAPGALK